MCTDEAEEKAELMTATEHRDCTLVANVGVDSAISCVNSVITASTSYSVRCVGRADCRTERCVTYCDGLFTERAERNSEMNFSLKFRKASSVNI